MDGLAENQPLPAAMIRSLFARRRGLGEAAERPDLTDDMIAEIIAIDDHHGCVAPSQPIRTCHSETWSDRVRVTPLC